jgi:D-beta-D-heptose 7-phosphate kinase/D-beta-D-heptose 1-phosphate adenosyltransferase
VVGALGGGGGPPAEEIARALLAADRARLDAKVLPLARLVDRLDGWRREGLRIGLTNGCFDLLHPGHVSLLAQARAACDRLVVGLNTDASVSDLKGPGRPVQGEAARALVLAALADVDAVVLFAEPTPLRLIEAIRPDVLVKGRDYRREDVVGAAFVEGYGGRVLLAELTPGYSTSATVGRLGR